MIEISHLTKKFDSFTAVDDLSFKVEEGEVLGFLGPNGAGKSTTMKIITGFLGATSGSVTVHGHDISTDPLAVKSLIGYLPEGAPSYPDMTVLEFLDFIAEVRGFSGEQKKQRIAKVILEKSRQGMTAEMPVKINERTFALMVWNTALINNSAFGWSGKVFRVTKWRLAEDGPNVLEQAERRGLRGRGPGRRRRDRPGRGGESTH